MPARDRLTEAQASSHAIPSNSVAPKTPGTIAKPLSMTTILAERQCNCSLQRSGHVAHDARLNDSRGITHFMLWKSIVAICVGASLGALLRWGLSVQFNSLFPSVPPGTLLSNLIGGYLVGVAVAVFATSPGISPEWKLLVITGFCGGLTTFSAFSAEMVALIQQGQLGWALGAATLHLVGSVAMTFAGIGTVMWLRS